MILSQDEVIQIAEKDYAKWHSPNKSSSVETACCYDCRNEWIRNTVVFWWIVMGIFYNPEPKRYPIRTLKIGKDSEGNEIYLCNKHYLRRKESSSNIHNAKE